MLDRVCDLGLFPPIANRGFLTQSEVEVAGSDFEPAVWALVEVKASA